MLLILEHGHHAYLMDGIVSDDFLEEWKSKCQEETWCSGKFMQAMYLIQTKWIKQTTISKIEPQQAQGSGCHNKITVPIIPAEWSSAQNNSNFCVNITFRLCASRYCWSWSCVEQRSRPSPISDISEFSQAAAEQHCHPSTALTTYTLPTRPTTAGNEPGRSLKFHNVGIGPYKGLLLVESTY